MSTTETSRPPKSKGKDKEKDKKPKSSGSGQKSQTERLKTVVRRLPPNLPEDVFWRSVGKWVSEETVSWRAYYPGKFKTRLNKENIPSRAYIAFRDEQILASFSQEYDGHVFRDKNGNESIAVVEFAPFQKVPNEKKKADSRAGTIEKDEDYVSFLESLKEVSTKPFDADTLETLIASTQPTPLPTTTPLLEALKAEKSAQKDKEAILRNHAHYKDPAALAAAAASTKKGDKKKDGAGGGGAKEKAGDSGAGPSKKGPKKGAAAAKAAAQQQGQAQSGASKDTKGPGAKQGASKPPKPPRERKGGSSASSAAPPAPSSSSASATASAAASTGTAAATSSSAPGDSAPAPSRRSRPVLGLASRQFEAALSGAGVERKSRREREKEKDKEKEKESGASTSTSAAIAAATATDVSSTPAPKAKEEKRERGSRRGGAPPTILQRDAAPKILARPAEGQGAAEGSTLGVGAVASGAEGGDTVTLAYQANVAAPAKIRWLKYGSHKERRDLHV
uniref:N/A n=1 Tax=Ganoderma boninense TaxID=34458 RepID=A0A5K1JTH7_9APHY|nr:N/A [Ganoderma boninense]